jgi:transglutaminase-like putative cysteine protease
MNKKFKALISARNFLPKFNRKPKHLVVEPLPKKALQVLLAVIILTVIPHIEHLPIWICLLGMISLFWAWQVHRGRWPFPSVSIKVLLVLLFSAFVVLSFGGGFTLDSAVALFVAGLVLKPLELYNRRHGFILIFLCYLLVGVSFIYQQSIVFALYQFLMVVLIISAQLAVNSGPNQRLMMGLKRASVLFLQSLPLMLILFIFVPRMGPIWHNPFSSKQGLTGLSDVMSPGDIAQLTKSNELAFRVEFEKGVRPAQSTLYWRALVLDQFDGRTWRKSYDDKRIRFAPQSFWYAAEGDAITYHIIQEATEKTWLFGLAWPVPETENTGRTHDFRLVSRTKLLGSLRYKVTSYPDAKVDQKGLRSWERARYLTLPEAENQATHQWVADLKKSYQEDQALINVLMQHFRQEPFYYSLNPEPLGSNNTIDRFLFKTKTGFCAHYSGALVYALRAAGIPARMVTGYQGGEWNQEGEYLTVRQYDAHAWVEAWLQNEGWISLDPTAMVAPERIEQSLQEAVGEQAFNEGRSLSARQVNIKWLQHLRFELEALNYEWTRWVLSYNRESQQNLFKNWFGSARWSDIAKVFIAVLIVFMLLAALLALKPWQRPKLSERVKRWMAFEAWAKQAGYERHLHETPMMFGQRIALELPQFADDIISFVTGYTEVEYVLNGVANTERLLELDECLKRLRHIKRV